MKGGRPTLSDKLLKDYQQYDTQLLRYRWGESLFTGWLQFSLALVGTGVLINIDFHFMIGGTVTLLGIILLLCTVCINIATEFYSNDTKRLRYLDCVLLWIVRVICFVLIGLFLWTVIIMYSKSNT